MLCPYSCLDNSHCRFSSSKPNLCLLMSCVSIRKWRRIIVDSACAHTLASNRSILDYEKLHHIQMGAFFYMCPAHCIKYNKWYPIRWSSAPRSPIGSISPTMHTRQVVMVKCMQHFREISPVTTNHNVNSGWFYFFLSVSGHQELPVLYSVVATLPHVLDHSMLQGQPWPGTDQR